MAEGRLNITVLTAEDSLKVFRMTQERIDAALERFPEFKQPQGLPHDAGAHRRGA